MNGENGRFVCCWCEKRDESERRRLESKEKQESGVVVEKKKNSEKSGIENGCWERV